MVKILNWLVVIVMSGLVFFLSAFFFLGGLEDFKVLEENLLRSFAIRFSFFYVIVILCVVTVYFGNVLFLNLQSRTAGGISPKIAAIRALLVLSLSDLFGTSIFFFG